MKAVVNIYRGVLKYPPFSVQKKHGSMRIVHHLSGGGEVICEAIHAVTVNDAEKIFAAVFYSQNVVEGEMGTLRGTVKMQDIRRITGCNDDAAILVALRRAAGLVITCKYEATKTMTVTHLIHKIVYRKDEGQVDVLFDTDFYNACREKGLMLDLETYCGLSPTAKNLYSFLTTNSGDKFRSKLLIERSCIFAKRHSNARKSLFRSLNELRDRGIINSFSVEKEDRVDFVCIEKEAGGRRNIEIEKEQIKGDEVMDSEEQFWHGEMDKFEQQFSRKSITTPFDSRENLETLDW